MKEIKINTMKKVCILFAVLFFAVNSFAESTYELDPQMRKVYLMDGLLSVTGAIGELDDGTVGIVLTVKSKSRIRGHNPIKTFGFRVPQGQFVRSGDELFLVAGDQQILVATHRWWFSPYWSLTRNTRIKTDVQRDPDFNTSRRLVISPVLTINDTE